jgi:capsular exopolysaccharide synthesis family protein
MMKSEPKLQDYISVVIERRWLIIVCMIAATIGAFVLSLILPKIYEAQVKFKLDLSESKPMFFSEIYTPKRVDPVESQLEIIRSRTLARSVVKELNLNFVVEGHQEWRFESLDVGDSTVPGRYTLKLSGNGFTVIDKKGRTHGTGTIGELYDHGDLRFLIAERPPDNTLKFTVVDVDKSADALQENVSASQIKNTYLVLLKAKSHSPELSVSIANTLAREYINYSLTTIREVARGSKEFIESQIAIFGEELSKAEEGLRQYKEKAGIFLLDESAKEIITAAAEFEVERAQAVVELQEVESTIANLEDELSEDEASYGAYKKLASYPTVSNSPLIVTLKQKLKSLEVQRQELLLKSGSSAEIAEIEKRIAATAEELQEATKKIVLAGPPVQDPVLMSIITNVINSETRAIAVQSRIDALDQIIDRQNKRLKKLPEAEVNLAQLTRQKMANEEIYTMLLGKLEESKIAESMQISEARVIDIATLPDRPVQPKPKQYTILGFLLGACIGLGGAFLLENLDTSLKSSKEIEEITGLSVLATIPLVRENHRPRVPTIDEPHSQIAEAYRILRTNIAFAATAKPIKSVLITSTLPQEGKTTTCINLGITLAQQGHRTIILDCDFRRPMLHSYFAQLVKDNHHGLSDVLLDRLKLKDSIVKSKTENLSFITSGTIPSNPAELLGSLKMGGIIEEFKENYEYVIIDAPPALGVADARVLGKIADAIIVVVMARKTNRDAVLEVKDELERSGEKIIGFVLNGVDLTRHYYRNRYYYYYPHK